jgi:hypothetical protein
MKSILDSVKKMLGIELEHDFYDEAIVMHINSAFMTLHQLGIGPPEGFSISDNITEWTEFLSEEQLKLLGSLKTFIFLKVKLVFDPPTSSYVLSSVDASIKEAEWRMKVQFEKPIVIETEEEE